MRAKKGAHSAAIRESSIEGGPLVLTHAMPQAQTVALGMFINVGSRDEPDAQAGIAHALEHMLFKGTKHMDAQQLGEALDRLGGNANAFTSREHTCLHMHVLHEDWQEALDLMLEMLLAATVPEEEWRREREVIFSEIAMVEDTPEEWTLEQHVQAYFPGQAIGRSTLGSHEALKNIDHDDLMAFLRRHYRPPRLLLAAAGNVEHDALVARLSECTWDVGEDIKRSPPVRRGCGVHCLPRNTEQVHVALSVPGINAADEQRPLAWLANQILGGGMSSHLFREVREKRGLAYSVGSHLSSLSDVGMWTVTLSTEPERLQQCIDVVRNTLAQFAKQLQQEELTRAARQLVVQLRMSMDNVETNMLRLGNRFDEAPMRTQEYWVERVLAVKLDALQHWAREHLAAEPLWTLCGEERAIAAAAKNCGPIL